MDVRFPEDEVEGCVLLERKASDSTFVLAGKVIMEYELPDKRIGKISAGVEGLLKFEPDAKKGRLLSAGTLLAKITSCDHAIVMKGLCAECGADLIKKNEDDVVPVPMTSKFVSMVHHVPELVVSDKLAIKIGAEDRARLLSSRRLVLLVDLDQTIIHTSDRLVAKKFLSEHSEIIEFYLHHTPYFTKLRPYTSEFLKKMHTMYEMHIVTFGQRLYAHKIAQIIDPSGIYFRQRILSRDELLSVHHKTTNLEALFPSNDVRSMIAIIDDRADVWQFSDALIPIRPYRYFTGVGDINAAACGHAGEPLAPTCDDSGDTILKHAEEILTQIHADFYNNFDQTSGQVKDLKIIIKERKSRVLKGMTIALSGVVPIEMKQRNELHRSLIYSTAMQFGAKIVDEVTESTDLLIAVEWGTKKVAQAEKLSIPIVSPAWLFACTETWTKADPAQFKMDASSSISDKEKATGRAIAHSGISDIGILAKDDLQKMMGEIDEELDGDDDDDDDEADAESMDDQDEEDVTNNTSALDDDENEQEPATDETTEVSVAGSRKRGREDDEWAEDDYGENFESGRPKIDIGDGESDDEREEVDFVDADNSGPEDGDEDDNGDDDNDDDLNEMASELEHELAQ